MYHPCDVHLTMLMCQNHVNMLPKFRQWSNWFGGLMDDWPFYFLCMKTFDSIWCYACSSMFWVFLMIHVLQLRRNAVKIVCKSLVYKVKGFLQGVPHRISASSMCSYPPLPRGLRVLQGSRACKSCPFQWRYCPFFRVYKLWMSVCGMWEGLWGTNPSASSMCL